MSEDIEIVSCEETHKSTEQVPPQQVSSQQQQQQQVSPAVQSTAVASTSSSSSPQSTVAAAIPSSVAPQSTIIVGDPEWEEKLKQIVLAVKCGLWFSFCLKIIFLKKKFEKHKNKNRF